MLSGIFLQKLDRLALAMREKARGAAGGVRRSRSLGSSLEFSDFREYTPGDDLRRIDWNAHARFDKLFLKLFMEEQEGMLTVLLDASGSMAEAEKWNAAVQTAEALIYLALTGGDRARVVAFGGATFQSPVYAGRMAFARAAQFLSSLTPSGTYLMNERVTRVSLTPRGTAALVGDFLSGDGYDRALSALSYKKQLLMIAQVLTREELSPTLTGPVRLIDAEDHGRLEVHAGVEALRAYERALRALIADLGAQAHRYGAPYALINASEDFEGHALGALVRAGFVV